MKFEFDYQCDKEWDEMKGGDRRRFCDSCDKHVHHISGMSEKQAKEFLERHNYEVCVDFYRDGDGNTVFSEKLERQNEGLKQLVASALAIVPLALGAAFIDFDKAEAPQPVISTASPAPSLPPIALGGPAPVVVNPTFDNDLEPPTPVIPDITPDPIAPEVDDNPIEQPNTYDLPYVHENETPPDLQPEPVIRPPRPHVRGRIARPTNWKL